METIVSYLLMLQKYIISKESEIKDYALCLGNISNDFTINNLKKKQDKKELQMFFLLILILLTLTIFQILINIWWIEHDIK